MELGDRGEDVAAWQDVLVEDGRHVGRTGVDGDFGKLTHNATVAWQRARALTPDGRVGPQCRASIGEPSLPPTMRGLTLDELPFIKAANWSPHRGPQTKHWIVLHSMEAREASTVAENVAQWFAGNRGEPPRSSAHYCLDDDSVVCCVPPDMIAWHAPGANKHGIGIEHAGFARQTAEQWQDDFSQRMLRRSAWLTRELCRRFGIPVEFIDAAGLKAGDPGITTHHEVTLAFRRSTHTDPGDSFPMSDYLRMVRQAA